MTDFSIIVTGLPASGKSSIGEAVARELEIPCFDKDVYLERLFDQRGIGDGEWRRQLSIEADGLMERESTRHNSAVLVSHWRPHGMSGTGTPTDWVRNQYAHIIELYCYCEPAIAARRFETRERHVGHLDGQRSQEDLLKWMNRLALGFPLGIGNCVQISTETEVDVLSLKSKINELRI